MVPVSRPGKGAISRRQTVGAALVGLALLGSTVGAAAAQDASPEASPMASPVAVAAWIDDVAIDLGVEPDGDSTTVGVIVGDVLEINVAEFETRPFVGLQTANNTDGPIAAVLLMVSEAFDPATLILPGEEAGLPEGVTPVGSYLVPAGTQVTAFFRDLAPGSYVLATTNGQAVGFVVTPPAEVEVPDIFATPAG